MILLSMILIPVILAPFAWLGEKLNRDFPKFLSLGVGVFLALSTAYLIVKYPGNDFAFGEFYHIYPPFDFNLHLAVDGISLVLLAIVAFLSITVTLSSWNVERPGAYFFLVLAFLGPMVGVFTSLNLLWFFIFWEFTLVPMFFHIGIWGAENRIYAAMKFFIYTHLASVFLLLGIIVLYLNAHTFDFLKLLEAGVDPNVAKLVWILMFIGFAVKMPVVPFHTWLPDAHVQAPSPISVFLAGLLLKMGAYGLLRWEIFLFPHTSKFFAPLMAFIAVLTIFYAGFRALAEDHIKRMVAYSSINHMGFVLLGLSAITAAGISAAIYEMVGHALIISLLFMIAGYVHHKTHTWYISEMGGIMKKIPALMTMFVIGVLAAVGLPGTAGFVGELSVMLAAFDYYGWVMIIVPLASALGAGFFMWMLQRAVFGPLREGFENMKSLKELPFIENLSLALYIAAFIFVGVVPSVVFNLYNPVVDAFAQLFR
ncbi:NADH dehydrogenase subunit M [Desulfurobacterium pacificum]|uniref:NADH dehydrogenase subunit M n=1 Tax=Desulfurobacterium pacificum TaxID=240166 RepID=A0ABY1NKX6_9BACT|nr:NADH-quinone oxidoreductase subunit M [Desulfurobacterium pacificum]SMP11632.1 NADH dehydrogenase subunit M [Desulfurobacterium pacificum]